MVGIYKIENLINGKKYIGQSVDIHARILDHKRVNNRPSAFVSQKYPLYLAFKKYGIENFSFEVVEECKREELDDKEKYWIKMYHSFIQENGYNLTYGGHGNLQITDKTVQIIVDLWNNGYSTGEIEAIVEYNKHVIIKYLKLYSNYTTEEGNRRGRVINGISHQKGINQYDLLGNFIKNYESVKQCAEQLDINISGIIKNAKFKTKAYYNYYFIYANENQKEGLEKHKKFIGNSKPVVQMDFQGNILNYFESATAAARSINKKSSNISACCSGKSNSAYGFFGNIYSGYAAERIIE